MVRFGIIYILTLLFSGIGLTNAQDIEIPLAPVLDLVSLDPFSGHSSLEWTRSTSPDVAGYIIYLYINQEGYAIDTLSDPFASTYLNIKSNASSYQESYVIAAFDSSDNTSLLSNILSTIYLTSTLDTCNHSIDLLWNDYETAHTIVSSYCIYVSIDGSEFTLAGTNQAGDTTISFSDFQSDSEFCYYVEAVLSGGSISVSNMTCLETNLINPPAWINADYAGYNEEGDIELSFSIDPASEIELFRIERSNDPYSGFETVSEEHSSSGQIFFIDENPPDAPLYYRLAAINNCMQIALYSNIASAISISVLQEEDEIEISWTPYLDWEGNVSQYELYRNHSGQFYEIAVLNPPDSSYSDRIIDFAYEVDQSDICYYVIAREGYNPRFSGAVSKSNKSCIEHSVNIFVPNAFTPNEDNKNDTFRPILSFTPTNYKLIIKTRAGVTVFETNNYLDEWDGKYRNKVLAQDVYIWFLEAESANGKTNIRSGTITIIFN